MQIYWTTQYGRRRHVKLCQTRDHPRRSRGGQLGKNKWRRKFSKKVWERTWDASVIELLPPLIWMLVSNWAQTVFLCSIKGQLPSRGIRDLLIRSSLPSKNNNSTVPRTCLVPAGELSSRRVFSFSVSPQSLLYQFHSILLYHCVKVFKKVTNLKGRKNFSCSYLTRMPSRYKQPRRQFRMKKHRSTACTAPQMIPNRKWSRDLNDPQNGPQMILDRKWSPKLTANDPVKTWGMEWILWDWLQKRTDYKKGTLR